MRYLMPVFLFLGCGPVEAVLLGDIPGDTDADTDTEPVDPYPLRWEGGRDFRFFSGNGQVVCEDGVFEDGIEVTREAEWQSALDICPSCEWVFTLEVGPPRICDGTIQIATEVVRGVRPRSGDNVTIYNLTPTDGGSWRAEELAEGTLRDGDLEYRYEVGGSFSYEADGYAALQ